MTTREQLTLSVEVPSLRPGIRYGDKILMNGSCFTEHISDKLLRYKYQVLTNPFGILYNPVSIAVSMERIAKKQYYTADELVFRQGLYHSLDHHGQYSGKDIHEVTRTINHTIDEAYQHLQQCKAVCISPGTAKVYRYRATKNIVGNCHKLSSTAFDVVDLTFQECLDAYERIHDAAQTIAPGCRMVWTISPVRHFRDGLIHNQRSKATLIIALHQYLHHHPDAYYFPAYEIMMDELRDYRFYARDLVHPSPLAVDIIWEKFVTACIDEEEQMHHQAIEKIRRSMEHRFLHDDPDALKVFAAGQLKQIETLAHALPQLNWQQERQYFFQYLDQG